jgi:hypothetical protein
MSRKSIALMVLALGLASGPALACKGNTVLLQADFRQVDPSWDGNLGIGGGVAKIAPDPGYLSWPFYQGSLFTDADICVDVTIPTGAKPNSIAGGLVFWASDYQNFYAYLVANGGTMAILRRQNGKFLSPVGWRKAEGVNLTDNAPNTLRITLKGKTATTYINDKPFVTMTTGQPPDGGSQIGLYGESEQDKTDTWTFSNLKVTNVP